MPTAKSDPALGRRRRKPQTPATVRRNERERNRVRNVNSCFSRLRQFVSAVGPNGARRQQSSGSKRLSKVDTLRAAIGYIRQLQQVLHQGEDAERFQPHNYPQVTIVDLEPARKRSCLNPPPQQPQLTAAQSYVSALSSTDEEDGDYEEDAANVSSKFATASVGTLSPSCNSNGSSTTAPGHCYSLAANFVTNANNKPMMQSVPTASTPYYPMSPYYTTSSPKTMSPFVQQQQQCSYSTYQQNHQITQTSYHCAFSPVPPQQHHYVQANLNFSSPTHTISPTNFHGVPQQAQMAYYWQNQQQQQQQTVNYCR